jgi:hypothetical protein
MNVPRRISSSLAALTALAGVLTGSAQAATPPGKIAFQANTGYLWTANPTQNLAVAMASGSSPALSSIGQIAIQNSAHQLVTLGPDGKQAWPLYVNAGSSPSIVATPAPSSPQPYTAAINADKTGDLWTVGTSGSKNWGAVLAPFTNPSIAGTPAAYAIAFQNSSGMLEVLNQSRLVATSDQLAGGSSPSITKIATSSTGNEYEIAYRSTQGTLSTVTVTPGGVATAVSTSHALAAGSNPSISSPGDGTYVVAYRDAQGDLDTVNSKGTVALSGIPVTAGTSPSVETGWSNGSYKVAYQAGNHDLSEFSYTVTQTCTTKGCTLSGSTSNQDLGLGMLSSTSPSLS